MAGEIKPITEAQKFAIRKAWHDKAIQDRARGVVRTPEEDQLLLEQSTNPDFKTDSEMGKK